MIHPNKFFCMKRKFLFSVLACLLAFFYPGGRLISQNVGIGTNNPQAKLHVEGDFKLKNGIAVNTISADSMFAHAADSVLPTQKALQRYMQKGLWAPAGGSLQSSIVFRDSSRTNIDAPWSVFVQGNYAYAGTNSNRLCIYDISNPDNIVAKGFTSTNLSSAKSVFVKGNYAFIASQGNNRLCIYDISNPDAIVAKDTIGQNIVGPRSVYVQGNFAYVAGISGLSIYDISNPDAIVPKGKTFQNVLANPSAVFVQGNYAYLASGDDGTNSRLCIYDISNPETIVPKGFTSQNLNFAQSVFVQGNYAYVGSTGNSQLSVYDISNPDNIVFAGSNGTNLANPTSVFVKNNHAFVTSFTNNALVAFQLYNNGRSLGTGTNGELVLEPAAWVSDANGAYRVGGNVGIGTVSPTQKLDVIGTTRTTQFQMTAGAGANRLLQSDASGNASWVSNLKLGEEAGDV